MQRTLSTRIVILLATSVTVALGLALLLTLLGQEPREIGDPTTPESSEPVVATVYDQPIYYSYWMEAVLIDQVMTGLAGQPAPTPLETLDRLINEALVLHESPPREGPTGEEIEAQIASLEQAWGVEDAAVVAALEQTGLSRVALERAVGRLLVVEASLQDLIDQGYDTDAWLEEQRLSSKVKISDEATILPRPTILAPSPAPPASPLLPNTNTSPVAPPPSQPPAIAPPPTVPPPPTVALTLPEIAPDFTLERAGGEPLTLSDVLEEKPVVLVFFQRCG